MANLADNRKAHFDYDLGEKYEGGIELVGGEVKSVRAGRAHLTGSYVKVLSGEVWLLGARIDPYQPSNIAGAFDPERDRRLLFTKKEIAEFTRETDKNGLTLVPLSLYSKGRRIKIGISLAKGKKSRDKRETIKRRESDRDIQRTLKT